ncbi:MAG: DUF3990 domain-containing protein [Bacteroidales bacterium]|nr:DUF3990 domain-containing protein [Bacteroidales bacterium]
MANIYLYHGSNQRIESPKWNIGEEGRDFGRCFYTTYDRRTARDWAKKNFGDNPIVNKYVLDLEKLTDGTLRIKRFNADAEWAEFVWKNRYDRKYRRPDYDIIIGPMADRGLKKQFMKMRTEGKSFAEVAPFIHYDRFQSMQVCFCSDYAVRMLDLIE